MKGSPPHATGRRPEVSFNVHDQDYGSRDYSARDLEGNLWNFGTYAPGEESAHPESSGAAVESA
jgi:hypothetical protein